MIVALLAALIGPFFVDWGAYKDEFEQRAERILGHPVKVYGEADVKILPSPSLTFYDVRVGAADDPLMTVTRFAMEAELMPLLTGQLQINELILDEPVVTMIMDKDGRIDWLGPRESEDAGFEDPDSVILDNVVVSGGSLNVHDDRANKIRRIRGINFSASAPSLNGPYKAEGWLVYERQQVNLQLSTGKPDSNGAIRLKANITPTDAPINVKLEGLFENANGRPNLDGDFSIQRILDRVVPDGVLPWDAKGKFDLAVDRLLLEEMTISQGEEGQSFGLEGAASIQLGPQPSFESVLTAKQIDLDRTYGAGPNNPVSLAEAGEKFRELLDQIPIPQIPGRFALDIPGIVVGGDLIREMQMDVVPRNTGWQLEKLRATLPGRTPFSLSGLFTLGDALQFQGALGISSKQPSAFASWWRQGDNRQFAKIKSFQIESSIQLDQGDFQLQNLRAQIDKARIAGSLSWRGEGNGRNAAFEAKLEADTLDVDQLSGVLTLFARDASGREFSDVGDANSGASRQQDDQVRSSPVALSVQIRAENAVYRDIPISDVDVTAQIIDDNLSIDTLSIGDLAGSRILANGEITGLFRAPDGAIKADISSRQLDGFASLMSDLLPNNESISLFRESAGALSPARMTALFSAKREDQESNATLTLKGEMGGTTVDVVGTFQGSLEKFQAASIKTNGRLSNENALQLLRQIPMLQPTIVDDQGSLGWDFSGRLDDKIDGSAVLKIGEHSVEVTGHVKQSDDATLSFDSVWEMQSPNLSVFADSLGIEQGELVSDTPLKTNAQVAGLLSDFKITGIRGQIAEAPFRGALHLKKGPSRWALTGDLQTARTGLQDLSALLIGANHWTGLPASNWPERPFVSKAIQNLDTDIQWRTDILKLGSSFDLNQAEFNFRLGPGELSIDAMSGRFGSGRLTGGLNLRRAEGEVGVDGQLAISDLPIEDYAWQREGVPVLRGTGELSLSFEGSGRSVGAIFSSLSGGGEFSLRDGKAMAVNPRAFDLILRAVDAGVKLEEQDVREIFSGFLDAGDLEFDNLSGSLSIASGIMRLKNVSLDADGAAAIGSVAFNLSSFDLKSDWKVQFAGEVDAGANSEPAVNVSFTGPLSQPRRGIDVVPLVSYLRVRDLSQKVREIERIDAEILERDRLFRELKRGKQLAERREREALQEAERLRLEIEEQQLDQEQGQPSLDETVQEPVIEEGRTLIPKPVETRELRAIERAGLNILNLSDDALLRAAITREIALEKDRQIAMTSDADEIVNPVLVAEKPEALTLDDDQPLYTGSIVTSPLVGDAQPEIDFFPALVPTPKPSHAEKIIIKEPQTKKSARAPVRRHRITVRKSQVSKPAPQKKRFILKAPER